VIHAVNIQKIFEPMAASHRKTCRKFRSAKSKTTIEKSRLAIFLTMNRERMA
jgi:hypothetical protein